jgi:predicted DNA-binding protein (UPF0251 family)
MSAAFVLPFLQARAEFVPILKRIEAQRAPERSAPRPQLAFYRKYAEALLRRYTRMSLEVGRVPSVLGRGEMFRARVSSYRVESFEDVVIFCHDIERCVQRLSANQQVMIETLAIKDYSAMEAAPLLGMCRETVIRRYTRALDRLTAIFLETRILDPSKCCQAPRTVENVPSECN